MEDDTRLLHMEEAAKMLGISRSQAYVLARSGDLPGAVRVGNSLRVSSRHLLAWIERHASMPGVPR